MFRFRALNFYLFCAALFSVARAAGLDFAQCFANITSDPSTQDPAILNGVRDNHGNPTSVASATAMSYELCLNKCGHGQETPKWSVFSTQFSSWLLPSLALLSQLPFGSHPMGRMDDIMSVVLTVGSPMLAAYSLVLTRLNGHWIAGKLACTEYRNANTILRVLSSLQQSPIRVSNVDGSLAEVIICPEYDIWWTEMRGITRPSYSWTTSTAVQMLWVLVAYLFTVANSFGDIIDEMGSNSQSIGSAFLWLLPIVAGWLVVAPKSGFGEEEVSPAYRKLRDSGRSRDNSNATNRERAAGRNLERTMRSAISLASYNSGHLRRDEMAAAPIYNYARAMPWTASAELVSSIVLEAANSEMHDPSPAEQAWKRISSAQLVRTSKLKLDSEFSGRFFKSCACAMLLQWGTLGAAFTEAYYTPTKGLGCRSGAYIIYALCGTIVWLFLVISSFLSYYAWSRSSSISQDIPLGESPPLSSSSHHPRSYG